jgi:NitT/TauT family transport system permease protein
VTAPAAALAPRQTTPSRRTGRSQARRRKLQTSSLQLLIVVLIGLLWQLWAIRSDSLLIPTCTETLRALWKLAVTDHSIWGPFWESNKAVLVGFPLTVATAIPVGLGMARWTFFGRFMGPYSAVLLGLPIAPLLPLLLVAMGTGLAPRVVVVVLFSWIFVALNTRAGVRSVDPLLVEMAESFGAEERQVWTKVLMRGGMPGIVAGLRIGLSRALAGMVVAELLMVAAGVGGLLLKYQGRFEAPSVFAVVLAVIFESLIVMQFTGWMERRLVPWTNTRTG